MKRPLLPTLLATLCILLPLSAYCWGSIGHRVVAKIAYNRLTQPQQQWVDGIILSLPGAPKNFRNSFVEAATWPDAIKDTNTTYNPWHYTNLPYILDNVPLPPDATPAINVIWAIHTRDSILRQPGITPAQAAFTLSFLTHCVGDLHQPLHSTSRYSKQYTKGDRGGNSFALVYGDIKSLHSLWDDGCGYFEVIKKMKDPDLKKLKGIARIAAVVTKAYPPSAITDLQDLDPNTWAQESHDLAIAYAYNGKQSPDGPTISPNDTPSSYYLTAAHKIVAQRLATGGYRLAMVLTAIYQALHPG